MSTILDGAAADGNPLGSSSATASPGTTPASSAAADPSDGGISKEELRIRNLQSLLDKEREEKRRKEEELEEFRVGQMSEAEKHRYRAERAEQELVAIKRERDLDRLKQIKAELNKSYGLSQLIYDSIILVDSLGNPVTAEQLESGFKKAREYEDSILKDKGISRDTPQAPQTPTPSSADLITPPPHNPSSGVSTLRADGLNTYLTKEGTYSSWAEFHTAEPEEAMKRYDLVSKMNEEGKIV